MTQPHTAPSYACGCRCDTCKRFAAEKRAELRERQRREAAGPPTRSVDLLYVESPEWFADAACRGAPVGIFFPERGESLAPAIEVCDRCSVSVECLAYALDHGEKLGVWGGLSERQRRDLRKAWRKAG